MEMDVSVYNVSGQKIRTLYSGVQTVGEHYLLWNGNNESGLRVDPGIYLCLLKSESGILARKLSLVR